MGILGAVGVQSYPVLNHDFVVSLIDTSSSLALAKSVALAAIFDVALGGFSKCSGLEMSMEPEEVEVGGRNGETLIFPTRVEWGRIKLEKGMSAGQSLWDWHYGFATGNGKRRDGVIVLLNDLRVPHNIWYFRRGLPVKYVAPDLDAMENAVAIESIEIAHEGVWQVPYIGVAAAAAITAAELGT